MFISGSAQKSHISFWNRDRETDGSRHWKLWVLPGLPPATLWPCPSVRPASRGFLYHFTFGGAPPWTPLLACSTRPAFRKGASRCLYKPGTGRGGGVSSPTALTPVFILRLRKMAKVNRSRLVYFRANSESLLNLPNKMNFKIFIFSFHSSRKWVCLYNVQIFRTLLSEKLSYKM